MTDEVEQEASSDSDDESVPELTIEERQEALKKARWNVFMYLGIAALLFAFALYPFMSTSMQVDEGFGSADKSITVWGLPISGEDFTDIPVDVEVVVQSLPTDVASIEIFMIENPKGCEDTDGSNADTRTLLQNDKADHPNKYHIIEDPVESQTYEVEMSVDPGIYCMQVVVNAETGGGDFSGINVEANVDIYPTQLPLAIFAVLCLLMSGFAFIGAQKHGKYVKSLVEPKAEPSIEDTVLAQTSAARISAGPSGPPTGPSGPPTGPSGPPAAGPTGPPVAGQPVHLSKRQSRWLNLHQSQNLLLKQHHLQEMSMRTRAMAGSSVNSQMALTTNRCMSSKTEFMFRTKTLMPDMAL